MPDNSGIIAQEFYFSVILKLAASHSRTLHLVTQLISSIILSMSRLSVGSSLSLMSVTADW